MTQRQRPLLSLDAILENSCTPEQCIEEVRKLPVSDWEKAERLFFRGYRELQSQIAGILKEHRAIWDSLQKHMEQEESRLLREETDAALTAKKLDLHHEKVESRLHAIESLIDRARGAVVMGSLVVGLVGGVMGTIGSVWAFIQIGKHLGWW